MDAVEDTLGADSAQGFSDELSRLSRRPRAQESTSVRGLPERSLTPSVARLHGFDLLERPLVSHLKALPGQVVSARSTVGLGRGMVGHDLVVVFEDGDVNFPIIIGVLKQQPGQGESAVVEKQTFVEADGERRVIEAEREVVLRCGEASITLTRAGKVIIRGAYVMSRSSGYNKIKGAVVDIN